MSPLAPVLLLSCCVEGTVLGARATIMHTGFVCCVYVLLLQYAGVHTVCVLRIDSKSSVVGVHTVCVLRIDSRSSVALCYVFISLVL